MSNEAWTLPVPGVKGEVSCGRVRERFAHAAELFIERFGKIALLVIPSSLRFVAREACNSGGLVPLWFITHAQIEPYEQGIRDKYKLGRLQLAPECFAFVGEDGTIRVQSTSELFNE